MSMSLVTVSGSRAMPTYSRPTFSDEGFTGLDTVIILAIETNGCKNAAISGIGEFYELSFIPTLEVYGNTSELWYLVAGDPSASPVITNFSVVIGNTYDNETFAYSGMDTVACNEVDFNDSEHMLVLYLFIDINGSVPTIILGSFRWDECVADSTASTIFVIITAVVLFSMIALLGILNNRISNDEQNELINSLEGKNKCPLAKKKNPKINNPEQKTVLSELDRKT